MISACSLCTVFCTDLCSHLPDGFASGSVQNLVSTEPWGMVLDDSLGVFGGVHDGDSLPDLVEACYPGLPSGSEPALKEARPQVACRWFVAC